MRNLDRSFSAPGLPLDSIFGDFDLPRLERDHEMMSLQNRLRVTWGASSPLERGPIIGTTTNLAYKNVAGVHNGSAGPFIALAMAHGRISPDFKPDFSNTAPKNLQIAPNATWSDPSKIVTLDPWGVTPSVDFAVLRDDLGIDVRPTIAITTGCISMPELQKAVDSGRLKVDGKVLFQDAKGDLWATVTKAVIEPVWYIPGIAARLNVSEQILRQKLAEQMENERINDTRFSVYLPPISGSSVLIFGEPSLLRDSSSIVTGRVHDECNGSDVTGYDICSCRPFLAFGIELAIKTAQMEKGVGVIVYNYKEARGLGQVTKYLVYNRRKAAPEGDRPEDYFAHTTKIAGTEDARFQEFMPDVWHWLGVRRIDHWVSESHEKHSALVRAGIDIGCRVRTPSGLIPLKAHQVELKAKHDSGYQGDLPDQRVFGYDYKVLDQRENSSG